MELENREIWNAAYGELYGERWEGLLEALLMPRKPVARLNYFSDLSLRKALQGAYPEVPLFPNCLQGELPRDPPRDSRGLLAYYWMDAASLLPVLALEPKAGDSVLDMCAAPGGKSLCLAEALQGEGILELNDLSRARRNRLHQVLKDYMPSPQRECVHVSGRDAARYGHKKKALYDKILADVPCGNERHILHKQGERSRWQPGRTRSLQFRQYALLSSGFGALKEGGRIVYSTCSIQPGENDGVVGRLIKKKGNAVKVLPLTFSIGEKTDWGWQVLPDREGCGPLFMALLEKRNPDLVGG